MTKQFQILLLACGTIWLAVAMLPDDKLHAVVCDVGQGDGILIYKGTWQMVIDGGPDDKILTCLANHVPFYDRKIETVISTHPQADHLTGLISIAKRYTVNYFVIEPESNDTRGYRDFISEVKKHSEAKVVNVYAGDVLRMGRVEFRVIWPTKNFVLAHLNTTLSGPPPNLGGGSQGVVLGVSTDGTDLNGFGISGILRFGEFEMLLTGDVDRQVEPEEAQTGLLRQVDVLKVPHHGSKTGMDKEWLDIIRPRLAIISVGKNNRYGHPTREAIDQLLSIGAKIMRTDEDGSVEVVTDGIKWWVK